MPRNALRTAVAAAAVLVSLYVVAGPLLGVHYPPLTDMPFHASAMSILRHYFDPAYHFREQFSLHFMEAPYWTLSGTGALLALVLPIAWAAKLSVILLLLLLPAGLAVLAHGMKKSPLLGLYALPLVWTTLTHWGFINFMAAIGLFAMVVGTTLLVVDRPTASRQHTLAFLLILVFGTHIFRFPFALAAVLGTAVVMYPATRRIRPVLLPMLPSLLLMGVWLWLRPKELSTEGMEPLNIHPERLKDVEGLLFGAFLDHEERRLARRSFELMAGIAVACALLYLLGGHHRRISARELRWAVPAHLVPLGIALVFLLLFLTLPMQIGVWWYVYPREIVSALFIFLALMPNLPRATALRVPMLALIAYGSIAQARLVSSYFLAIDATNADFQRILKQLPQAPKLGYLVWDRDYPGVTTHPYLHQPAWVQAEKGGWLSFHFVSWNAWPIQYRLRGAAVPPPTPTRFEWTPERFDLKTRGLFFDWFLVRKANGPDPRFRQEKTLRLVEHAGPYWLYHREDAAPPASR